MHAGAAPIAGVAGVAVQQHLHALRRRQREQRLGERPLARERPRLFAQLNQSKAGSDRDLGAGEKSSLADVVCMVIP